MLRGQARPGNEQGGPAAGHRVPEKYGRLSPIAGLVPLWQPIWGVSCHTIYKYLDEVNAKQQEKEDA